MKKYNLEVIQSFKDKYDVDKLYAKGTILEVEEARAFELLASKTPVVRYISHEEDENDDLKKEIETLKSEIETKTTEVESKNSENDDLKKEIETLKSEIEKIKSSNNDNEKTKDSKK